MKFIEWIKHIWALVVELFGSKESNKTSVHGNTITGNGNSLGNITNTTITNSDDAIVPQLNSLSVNGEYKCISMLSESELTHKISVLSDKKFVITGRPSIVMFTLNPPRVPTNYTITRIE